MRFLICVGVISGFILLHIIKLMRMYLILMDCKIEFERFVPAYLRTTFINLIIPFKLGELYRIAEFWRISKGFKTGFFSVLVDRFFDTLALVTILVVSKVLLGGHVSVPVILLIAFLMAVMVMYMIFPSSFIFLNRYIITTKVSKRSMTTLKGLEVLNDWYTYVKTLVVGRYGILILLSVLAWILEISVYGGFVVIVGGKFTESDFGKYIDSIVTGATNAVSVRYTIFCVVTICILLIGSSIYYAVAVNRKKHRQK